MFWWRCIPKAIFLVLLWSGGANAQAEGHWVDTWTSMPQLTEPANLPPPPYNSSSGVFRNATIRQTIHLSVGAPTQIRVSVSNEFGTTDLPISAMTLALPSSSSPSSSIRTETLYPVTFDGGQAAYRLPAGALAVSDPLDFGSGLDPQRSLTVSVYLEEGQQGTAITSHPGSRSTTWIASGNQVEEGQLGGSVSVEHWYFVSAVSAWAPLETVSLVIVGDSITDGRGSTTDGNNRWPDQLFARLQNSTSPLYHNIAISNQAAGGNRVLQDGLGPSAISRIDRDVLAHPSVKYVLIYEGVNDIGTAGTDAQSQNAVGDQLISAYTQIIEQIHAFDESIRVFGGTITPFCGPGCAFGDGGYSDGTREGTRQRVNEWIRSEEAGFDGLVDFDEMVRDAGSPEVLDGRWDSGDYLHLNVAGYGRMAEGFPVELFD